MCSEPAVRKVLLDWKSILIASLAVIGISYALIPKYEIQVSADTSLIAWKINRLTGETQLCTSSHCKTVESIKTTYPSKMTVSTNQPATNSKIQNIPQLELEAEARRRRLNIDETANQPDYSKMSDEELMKIAGIKTGDLPDASGYSEAELEQIASGREMKKESARIESNSKPDLEAMKGREAEKN